MNTHDTNQTFWEMVAPLRQEGLPMRAAQNYFEDQEFDAIVGTTSEDLRVAEYLDSVGQLALNQHLDHSRREASLQMAAIRCGDIAVGGAILAETRRQLVGIY